MQTILDGIEYEIQHPNWDMLQPYSVEQSADLDGDGRLETLIEVGHGGNCCPLGLSILSYRGSGFFTYLDESPISGGWGGTEIVEEGGRLIIRIQDVPAGQENLATKRGERDYAMINGRPELIAERIEYGSPTRVTGLTLKEVQSADDMQKDIVFDIDQDGQQDVISCRYWQRWGVLNCTVQISTVSKDTDIQCREVVISNGVFGVRKSHSLLCDGEIIKY